MNSPSSTSRSEYIEAVQRFTDEKLSSDPGYFAKNPAQRYYELCQACPISQNGLNEMVLLVLPLRMNLIRSPILGCSDALNVGSIPAIVDLMNGYWRQAGIFFKLVAVEERKSNLAEELENDIKMFLRNTLRRGPDGKMMHKSERREKLVDVLLTSFDYQTTANTYDIWFVDMIGHQSQGICIDRRTRTVIMGERSTKGYDEPTNRPHDCLAKTAAHELGHALSLNHPMRLKFEDGQSQILTRDKKNLMAGGIDFRGGGGSFLEEWQICQARDSAEDFLRQNSR